MKKIVIAALVLVMLLSLCGCAKKGFDAGKLQPSEYAGIEMNTLVQMFIKQRTVTDATERLTLTLENTGEADYSFDAVQRLEVLLDGVWYVVPNKSEAVTMQLFHLPAGSTEEVEFVISGCYDKLVEGTYRIVKILVDADGATALASAEFNIGRG